MIIICFAPVGGFRMNYKLISETTYDMWRTATLARRYRNEDLGSKVKTFLQEGINNPGVAEYLNAASRGKFMKVHAEYCSNVTLGGSFREIIKCAKQIFTLPFRIKKTINSDSELSKLYKGYIEKYNTLYPRSRTKRQIILSKIERENYDSVNFKKVE